MGVYYECTACESVLRLAPQATGFGQLRIECPVCGGDAKYSPSKPSRAAEIIQVNADGVSALAKRSAQLQLADVQAAIRDQASAKPAPMPTIPFETPHELLRLDAVETAPTGAVKGLDAMLFGPPDEENTNPEVIKHTARLESLSSAGVSTLEESSAPTVAQPGLSDEIFARAQQARISQAAESSIEATVSVQPPTLPPSESTDLSVQPVSPKDLTAGGFYEVDEDKIPTRAVSGLSEREISSYAPELYDKEQLSDVLKQKPVPKPVKETGSALHKPSVAGQGPMSLGPLPAAGVNNAPAPSGPGSFAGPSSIGGGPVEGPLSIHGPGGEHEGAPRAPVLEIEGGMAGERPVVEDRERSASGWVVWVLLGGFVVLILLLIAVAVGYFFFQPA